VHLASLGAIGGIGYGSPFNLRDVRRNADHDARVGERGPIVRLANKVVQHGLGEPEICDYTVLHRLDHGNMARGAPDHLPGFLPHSFEFVGECIYSDCGGFVDDDATAAGVDPCVHSSQVNG
jgi:hypothetical protein